MRKVFISIALLLLFVGCNPTQNEFVDFKSDKISYMGRIGYEDSCSVLYWSGSSAEIIFEGSEIKVLLQDENGKNYYNIIIDKDSIAVLHPDTAKRYYTLASGLSNGKHSIKLFKRTEWTSGNTKIYGFQLNNDSKIFNPSPKEKSIEFYGNSITAGYAVEDYSGNDSPDSIFTNNYNSYAAITAMHFDANYNCIARSGIGITISWFPMIMQEMFYRLDGSNKNSNWDFSKFTPDVVVINLFQNDSWLVNMPEREEFKNRFGVKTPSKEFIINSYKKFVSTIREKYKDAKIICMLGTMDITRKNSPWPDYVTKAVEQLDDKNIYTLFVPYKETPGHPKVEEQRSIADSLIHFIEKNNLL